MAQNPYRVQTTPRRRGFSRGIKTFFGYVFFGVFGILTGILLLAYATAGAIYEYSDTMNPKIRLPSIDVVVCLAGGRGRITAASETWYLYWKQSGQNARKVPTLYISGMGPKANWDVLMQQISGQTRAQLKMSDVVMENESGNTLENAEVFAQEAKAKKWSQILLVTSSYHMRRASYIFKKQLGLTLGHPFSLETHSVITQPYTSSEWSKSVDGVRLTVIEYLKWVYQRMFWNYGFAKSNPFDMIWFNKS